MRLVQTKLDVSWLPQPNRAELYVSHELPVRERTTAAFLFLFHEDRLLLTNLNSRGWDIPGGHLESGEGPFDAMKRELYEETGATVSHAELIGYEKILLHAPCPEEYPYPYPDSYQVFYWGTLESLNWVDNQDETKGIGFVSFEEAMQIPCVVNNRALYEEAFERNKKWK